MQTTAPIPNVTLTPQSPASALADAWGASLPHTICEGRFRIEAAAFDVLRPQLIRAYRTHLQGIGREDASEFYERLAHYERMCFGAVVRERTESGEIVGSLLLEASEPGTLYIRWMNLLPRAQANGIPEALLRHLLRFARGAGCRRIEADIQFQNSNFLKVLSGRGFTVAGIQLSERWGSTVRLSRSIAPSSGSIPSRKEEQHHEEESQEVCSVHCLIRADAEEQDLPAWLNGIILSFCEEWFHDLEFFKRIEKGQVTIREILLYLEGLKRLIRTSPQHLKLAEYHSLQLDLPELTSFLQEKQVEEKDHDHWAENDLRLLGNRASSLNENLDRIPMPAVDRMVALICEFAATDLVGYVGYLLMAESSVLLAGPRCIKALHHHLGITQMEISVIQKHMELDLEHVCDDWKVLKTLLQESSRMDILSALRRLNSAFRAWIQEVNADEAH